MRLFRITRSRPPAILWFERLGLTGIATEIVQNILLFPRRSAKNGAGFEIAAAILVPLVLLALLLLASRRASRAARMALLLLVLGTIAAAVAGGTAAWWSDPPVLLGALVLLLDAAAITCAFLPSARSWFESGPGPADA